MLRSYLVVALRNARRDGAFSILNVLGLAIGLACGILILLYVQREFSYDRHHTKADRIHRVFAKWRQENGDVSYGYAAQGPVGPTLAEEFPEVEDATRYMRRDVNISFEDNEGVQATWSSRTIGSSRCSTSRLRSVTRKRIWTRRDPPSSRSGWRFCCSAMPLRSVDAST